MTVVYLGHLEQCALASESNISMQKRFLKYTL